MRLQDEAVSRNYDITPGTDAQSEGEHPSISVVIKESVMSLKRERDAESSSYEVDFDRLANHDPAFAAYYRTSNGKRRQIDFQDPQVLLQLTKSLLALDYGLKIELPLNRLIPPVPVRWKYIAWIQQLLDTTTAIYNDDFDQERPVIGIDIGVGASCIYPLLACAKRSRWQMLGTDIDEDSLASARRNVASNDLDNRIQLVQTKPDEPLISLARFPEKQADFVMTNPPFYESKDELTASHESKDLPPSALCTGNDNEMICPGGDAGFVTRIVEESLELRDRVQWYTAMMGKYSSLQTILALLKEKGISNFAVTSLQAGTKTKRWAVAWSFGDLRPRNDVARHNDIAPILLPITTATTIPTSLMSAEWAGNLVDKINGALEVRWTWSSDTSSGIMETAANVWSRAARRKRKYEQHDTGQICGPPAENDNLEQTKSTPLALAVKITCEDEKVVVRWLRGQDQILYQSYCGMLKRSLNSRGRPPSPNPRAQAP